LKPIHPGGLFYAHFTMKIYQPDALNGRRTVFVQPGNEYPNSDWIDEQGKARMLSVVFTMGQADVPDNLANYMVDKQLASFSPIILHHGVTA